MTDRRFVMAVVGVVAIVGFFLVGDAYVKTHALPHRQSTTTKKDLQFSNTSPYVRCRELRVEFFRNCMHLGDDEGLLGISRVTCETFWASVRGHVFDGDPRNLLTEEKDCSSEF